MCVHVRVYMCVCVHVCVCMCMCPCVCVFASRCVAQDKCPAMNSLDEDRLEDDTADAPCAGKLPEAVVLAHRSDLYCPARMWV